MISLNWNCHNIFADLLVYIRTSDVQAGAVSYPPDDLQPRHNQVDVTITRVPTAVPSPGGPAIACLDDARCDILWRFSVDDTCSCPFNISCCDNGLTYSFWWHWDLLNYPYYRTFMILSGCLSFYNPNNGYPHVSHKAFAYGYRQWFHNLGTPFGTWSLVTIVLHPTHSKLYRNGRFVGDRHSSSFGQTTVSSCTAIDPVSGSVLNFFSVHNVAGNYSLAKLLVWDGRKSSEFIWRHYMRTMGIL